MLISLLFENPLMFLMVVSALVISLSIHEFAHAFVAEKLGDITPKMLGRVTLDPRAHLDPIGSVMLLFAGFGWGKPVPFNPINLKNPKRDAALIAIAGPVSNFMLFVVVAILFKILGGAHIVSQLGGSSGPIFTFLAYVIFYNLVLGIFNLIPVEPLDGYKVVAGILPPNLYIQWMQMRPYGIYILLIIIFTGATDVIIRPIMGFLLTLLGL